MPQVSIITPCYNASRYISQTIESVLAQDYADWEMIIVDDGSKDDSAAIVESYVALDCRIRLISQINGGSANARNHGIREAKGRYIALLDADDLWEPCFLSHQLDFMKKHNAICVFSSYKRINENSEEIMRPLICRPFVNYKNMLITNQIGCLTGLYDSQKYGKIYLKEELKSVRDDYAYWLDIVKLENAAYGNKEVLASYRVITTSTTGNKFKLVKKQFLFYKDYLKLGFVRSILHTMYWALRGFIKFLPS